MKMSCAHKGKRHSSQWIANQAEVQRGRKKNLSSEGREQLSRKTRKRMLGNQFTKGRKLSEEHIKKIRHSLVGRKLSPDHLAKTQAILRKRNISEEHRQKLRIAWSRKTPDERRAITAKAVRASKLACPTSLEKTVAAFLKSKRIPYCFQYPLDIYIVDFFLPQKSLVIECDGEYWHSLPGARERDAKRDFSLMSQGYTILRLKEEEIVKGAFQACLEKML